MIPGITTRKRFARLGKIRLGEKRVSQRGTEYPAALDHFNFVDAPAVAAIYGADCTMLAPLLLPGNPVRTADGAWDFSAYWRTSRSAYGKGTGLFCRCEDGERATRVHKGLIDRPGQPGHGKPADPQGFAFLQEQGLDVEVGDLFDMPCPGEECFYFEKKMCKNLGSFDFLLPNVPGFGTWCVQTSSFNSIRNIESMLQMLADALGGQVAGIPLGLKLAPHQAQVEGKAKTVYVLEMICPHNLQQLAGLRRRALEAGGAVVALIDGKAPAPDDLFPNAGANLDATLAGQPAPQPAPAPPSNLGGLTQQLRQERGAPADDEPGPDDGQGGTDDPNRIEEFERPSSAIPTGAGFKHLETDAERERRQQTEQAVARGAANAAQGGGRGRRRAAPAAPPPSTPAPAAAPARPRFGF
jgi:hypothetical protein